MAAKATRVLVLIALVAGCGASRQQASGDEAGRLRRDGKLAEAWAAYGDALCAAPADLALALRFSEVWHELGQPGTLTARLTGCALAPGVRLFLEGLVAAAQGEPDRAEQLLDDAQRQLPGTDRGEVLYRRGLVALGARRPAVARALFDQAAALAPERADLPLATSQALLDLGEPAAAIEALRRLVKLRPDARDLERGRQLLYGAVRRAEPPLAPELETRLNQILSALDRADTSRDEMLAVLDLANEVEHPRVFTVAGIAALRFGAEAEGSRLLTRASELNLLDPDPPRALGIALLAAERPQEALAPLQVAFYRDFLDLDLARRLAQAAIKAGERGVAREAYRVLVVLAPNLTENHLELARCERQLGDLFAAGRAAEEAYRLEPTSIPVLLERAVIFAKLANSAPTDPERERAARVSRDTVAELLAVAPEHPGAAAILGSLPAR